MTERRAVSLDRVFQALADPTRRAMLRRLAKSEQSIGELSAPFSMTFAAASKHVKVLERAKLVRRRIEGRSHHCRLEAAPLAAANGWLRFYERFWTRQLDALDAALRAEDAEAAISPRKKGANP
ncbi:MAG TPA: metalloregulator ArsR/SmtB family transcription factor [Steroidobacteraceae bacterium]|jgi:DNA-binding transcriptional ArsR family regulator